MYKWSLIWTSIILLIVFCTENYGRVFRSVRPPYGEVLISDYTRRGCRDVTKRDLIKTFGSEKILREIMLSKGLYYNSDIDENAPVIADFLSGYNAHLNPMFTKTC